MESITTPANEVAGLKLDFFFAMEISLCSRLCTGFSLPFHSSSHLSPSPLLHFHNILESADFKTKRERRLGRAPLCLAEVASILRIQIH
ncbi:hypothetical protein D8674_018103 [Pyrus ussuriensis x Pyrus communis]|uniref:Uncharacterized protein n=1 Tax=Pyrus ussuriensis x Pyrus communis TaxID=2448454 RepID=A0A5N5G8G8_9ROSA|nr:hypothetical protein D8674_018103 [Pyrus ussuriensis x Pyrus communis]